MFVILQNKKDFHVSILHKKNSIVERKHDHILNITRALKIQFHLPKIYWSYSAIHVAHIINMLPTPILNYSSPMKCFTKLQQILIDKVF